jgi:hypothetical protein
MTSGTFKLVALAIFALVVGLTVHAWVVAQDNQQRLQSTLAAQKQVLDDANSRQRTRDAALNDTLAEIEKLKNTTRSSQQLVDQLQKYLALPQPMLLVNRGLSPSAVPGERSSRLTHQPGLSADTAGTRSVTGNSSSAAGSQSPAPIAELVIGPKSDHPDIPSSQVSSQRSSNSPSHLQSDTQRISAQLDQVLPPPTAPPPIPSNSVKACSSSPDCVAEIPAGDLKPLYNYVQNCRACDAELAVSKQNASDDATKVAALTRERDAAVTASKGGSFMRRLRRNILWFSVGAAMGYAAHR